MATQCPRVTPYVRPVEGRYARNRLRCVAHGIAYSPRIGIELGLGCSWRRTDLRISLLTRCFVFFVGHHPECDCDDCIPF